MPAADSRRAGLTGPATDPATVVAGLLVFAGYYVGARVGFALTFRSSPISVLWPPNSILLSALLLTSPRSWWFIILAAFPAHWIAQLQNHVPMTMVFCWFVSNSCEALIGAGCVRYFIGGKLRFDSLRNVGIFCLWCGFLGPFLSSFVDAAFVELNHWGQEPYWELWRTRFFSNVMTALTLAPAIVTWFTNRKSLLRLPRSRYLETGLLFLGLVGASFAAFYKEGLIADPILFYAPLPFLLWAAVRLGSCGTSTAILLVTFLGVWSAAHGHGPFTGQSPEENARSLQLFLIVISLPLILLAAVIEEHANTEAMLREREERINLAAESADLAFWMTNFEQGESWMSQKGRTIYGFGPDEPLSRELFLNSVHQDDRASVQKAIEDARLSPQTFEIEYRLARPDGQTRWHIVRGRYLRNARGAITELMGVTIDVTARVEANSQLRLQREEMAHLSRVALMGELTASLAHELNQPLTAIASNAAAGRRVLARGTPDPQFFEELLGDVVAHARRAGDVIHGIYRLVRKTQSKRQLVNLNQVINEALRLLRSDLLGRSTGIRTDLEPSLALVAADPIHLQQVILNLVMNSLEATEQQPVEQRRIVISTRADTEKSVVVTVRDYGVGLPLENPEEIFTHFFSTKRNGMGMGLTIVRSIIEAHDGAFGAENAEGGGARFFFRLPVTKKADTSDVL